MDWLGSSPRMRGARCNGLKGKSLEGIIPADAGSTISSLLRLSAREDHPRGCGEHLLTKCLPRPRLGSSPRMRGARIAGLPVFAPWRIIPADAGSTIIIFVCFVLQADHPRGCGEHTGRPCRGPTTAGSSPRMRGARVTSVYLASTPRIIPADAGSTCP